MKRIGYYLIILQLVVLLIFEICFVEVIHETLAFFTDGGLLYIGFFIISLGWTSNVLKNEHIKFYNLIFPFFLNCIIIYFFLFYVAISGIPEDVITYANEKKEKLVIQHYETGITGNSRFKAIIVNPYTNNFFRISRPGKIPDEFEFLSYKKWCEYNYLPDIIEYEKVLYTLENSVGCQ